MTPDTVLTDTLDRYLAETSPGERRAEASKTGDASGWTKYLISMPDGVSVRPDDGFITRAALLALAEIDRYEQSDRSALDLFWNTMAWGIAGTWRNIPGLSAYVAAKYWAGHRCAPPIAAAVVRRPGARRIPRSERRH